MGTIIILILCHAGPSYSYSIIQGFTSVKSCEAAKELLVNNTRFNSGTCKEIPR